MGAGSTTTAVRAAGLRIHEGLFRCVRDEIARGTGVDVERFWSSLAEIVRDLGPRNAALLKKRDQLQKSIDDYADGLHGHPLDPKEYESLLRKIGYLVPEGTDFQAGTTGVDREISELPGPQLVVPLDNARYALNAANARWGSLFDALYGTDVIPQDSGASRGSGYNPVRGARVIAYVDDFLDRTFPLQKGVHARAQRFFLRDVGGKRSLFVSVEGQGEVPLAQAAQFVGYRMEGSDLSCVLLEHHGLHVEIQVDRRHPVGRTHHAGVKDILLEAAVTTIEDCEDSVSAVDAADKSSVYRNWCGIMKGTLEATFQKDGRTLTRRLNPDRTYNGVDGSSLTLPGRSLLLVRNVGIHMYTDAVADEGGHAIPEGFLDAMVTSLAAIHDLRGPRRGANSRAGSIYIVKPKLHGPEEVAATVELFARVEDALGLDRNTLKIGVMDEERRTTVNLKECIRAARERVVFINTGFLDRTGDEIHTSMKLGAVLPKEEIKSQPWITAYEDWNVDTGLATGLPGRAQIGKGMWTMPDEMRAMMEAKIAHPRAGASTAWVPSPTAATLHALHYHMVDVGQRQKELAARTRARLSDILTPPLLGARSLSAAQVQEELDNNAQGVLGYVVRWVEMGIGCSKVPNIREVALMEDRATLRISSQHIANWLRHSVITRDQVVETFKRMAAVVDRQNGADPRYQPMAADFQGSPAFKAALDLVFTGEVSANGYTEEVLHARRREVKSREASP